MGHEFAPDASRARALDRSMHVRLGESLRHLSEQCRGVVEHDAAALEALASRLDGGQRQSPAVFAHYYRLMHAVLDEQFEQARQHFDALAAIQPMPAALSIKPLTALELGANYSLYLGMMNADPSLDLGFMPPSTETFEAFTQRLSRGWTLLESVIPELAGEIAAIIHEIVVVAGDKSKAFQFDGGSHFQLWGGLFLNGDFHASEVAVIEVLAHESAHSLLFGFSTDEVLVDNEDDELYASPLRPDPRPMDGIYHATFVSARMHWAMNRLLDSGALQGADHDRVVAANRVNSANFRSGHAVVEQYGRLTGLGQRLMHGAQRYMASASA